MSLDDLPFMLTSPEAAEFLRTTDSVLRAGRVKGTRLKYVKFGRRVYYRKSDLVAFLEQNTRHSTGDHEQRVSVTA